MQTPTLAILVEREEKIRAFVPRDYWEVQGTFRASGGRIHGPLVRREIQEDQDDDPDRRAPSACGTRPSARRSPPRCDGKPGMVSEETKPTTQVSPLLYDLTSLQREANGRFGFSARTTLSLAQALYEKHKVLTYPRTDSRALPEDYLGHGQGDDGSAAASPTHTAAFAGQILEANWVRPNKRIFNNAKISDHFAIIPTLQRAQALSEPSRSSTTWSSSASSPCSIRAAEYLVTTRITRVEGEPFKTEGKVLVNAGLAGGLRQGGAGRRRGQPRRRSTPGRDRSHDRGNRGRRPRQTKPPPRYSEATLLSAMEGAGKLVEDEELREAMREKGLGTPATRAQIIEGLIAEKYLLREGRELQPTAKAFSLMTLLHGFGVPELSSPELTARMGIQAGADGARQDQARRSSCTRSSR